MIEPAAERIAAIGTDPSRRSVPINCYAAIGEQIVSMLTKWSEVASEHAAVQAFLEWAFNEHGLDFDFERAKAGTPLDIRRLIDQFFEIDRTQLDRERRELLKSA